jgi:hypothetical protein
MTLYCNDPKKQGCQWSGDPQELVALTDELDDVDFTHCPYCEGADFEELDEEE